MIFYCKDSQKIGNFLRILFQSQKSIASALTDSEYPISWRKLHEQRSSYRLHWRFFLRVFLGVRKACLQISRSAVSSCSSRFLRSSNRNTTESTFGEGEKASFGTKVTSEISSHAKYMARESAEYWFFFHFFARIFSPTSFCMRMTIVFGFSSRS